MDFLASIRDESDRFYALADTADPTLGVPSCPGWNIGDLVWHLGEVHWFWSTDIETRATDPQAVEAAKPARPGDHQDLVAWGRSQADRLISILGQNDDTTTVWTWSPPHQTVGFIRRHQVQEAAVHRWDMQVAATSSVPDPIDELLEVTLPWGVSPHKPLSGAVHLHCLDIEAEWFVERDGTVESSLPRSDVALRGTASHLLLSLFKRVGFEDLEVIGNEALAGDFIERINTE